MFTFIKKGSIEYLAQLTNVFLFIIFIIVNALVLIYHHKTKTKEELSREKKINSKFLSGYPWYSILGLVITLVYILNVQKLKYPN